MRLAGKTALITGASRNMGQAVARRFAAEGADLVLGALQDREALNETVRECEALGVKALPVLADVSQPDQAGDLVRQGLNRFGKIDVLVSSVAIRPHTPFLDISFEDWRRILDVNLSATFYLAKAVVPSMIEHRSGSIIAFGGLVAVTGTSKSTASGASKTGLLGLIRCLATELAPHGIRANMVVPGNVGTERANPEWYEKGKYEGNNASKGTLMGRQGRPDEIANAVLFLASDESSYVTGDRLMCNGGRFMS
jgi:NAD(P)-dependent dehydrogenase (short-subunit alcohol dehydrogenase family)